jgi:dolichol kinase
MCTSAVRFDMPSHAHRAQAAVLCVLTLLALAAEERGWVRPARSSLCPRLTSRRLSRLSASPSHLQGVRALRGLQTRPAAPPGLPLGCVALAWCFAALAAGNAPAAASTALPAFWAAASCAAAALAALGAGARRGRPSLAAACAAGVATGAFCSLSVPATALAVAVAGPASACGAYALLRVLPRSATAGEALLASQALCAALAAFARHVAAGGAHGRPGADVDAAVLALVLAPLAAGAAAAAASAGGTRPLRSLLAACAALAVFHALAQRALGGTLPLAWLLRFMLAEPAQRCDALAAWTAFAAAPLPALRAAARSGTTPRILLRKVFHVIAAALAAPAAVRDPELLRVAFAAAFAALAAAEGARAGGVPRLGPAIHALMAPFADHRDSGALLLSHFSLLLGVAAPLWLAPRLGGIGTAAALPAWAGIVALGAGDVAASAAGHALRGRRLLRGWPKTWGGTAAGAAVSSAAALAAAAAAGGDTLAWRVVAAAVASAALEAVTAQLDNAFVPLQLFALLALALA